MLDQNSASFSWRSLYEFKESAKKEIIEHFKSLLTYGEDVKIQYDPTKNSFTLIVPKDKLDQASQTFMGVVKMFIEKHYTKNLGGQASQGKILRPIRTQMFIRELHWTDDPEELKKLDQDDILEMFEDIEQEVKGSKFEVYSKWTPKYKNTFRECFFADGVDHIEEIAQNSGKKGEPKCALKVEWVSRDVNIGAPNERALAEVIKKLNTAEEYYNWNYSRLVAHVINHDGRERFEIKLIPIGKQRTTIEKTTLFPPYSQWSSSSGRDKLASARLAEFKPESDQYENVTFSCNATYNAGLKESDLWKGYSYKKHIGVVREDTPEERIAPRPSTQNTTNNNEDLLSFGTRPTAEQPKKVAPAPIILPTLGTDQETGALAFRDRPQEVVLDLEEEGNLPTLAPKRKVRAKKTADASKPPPRPALSNNSTGASTKGQEEPALVENSQSLRPKFTPSSPSRSSDSGSSTPTVRPAQSNNRYPRPNNRRAENHRPQDSDIESQASEQEYKTRTFRDTQNQRGPHHRLKYDVLQVITDFQKNTFKHVFETGLEDMRRFRGDIRFEARIGRLVFPDVAKKYLKSNYTFQWSNWDENLHLANIKTLFTDIISNSPCDPDFIVGMKVARGDPLFENPPVVRNVSYEIRGLTFQKIPFILSIQAETLDFEIRTEEEHYGTVYWNCPTMTWDAEFRLIGCKFLKSLEPQAKRIVESLSTEECPKYPTFTIDTRGTDLKIESASCRRETRHMVLPTEYHRGHEFTLVVTEHIDLKLQEHPDFPGRIRFQAVHGDQAVRQNMSWYTIHIVADEIERALWNNRTLGFSQLTNTDTKDLLSLRKDDVTAMEAMVEVVSQILSKINNVGYSNRQYTLHEA
ncbi:hypothetical protein H072_5233 [Dactylellina haptotyla CBS 200.50]|uniref:Uncharacterized protein n=1 Tax=Dactylellina haptotyla (strain CBS 200.50) TaxID=1284197 RepID=S8BN70_DACHA|nr:hypothetical protein H072_5233 [Dactylellina haptotyla CBS 200.50]